MQCEKPQVFPPRLASLLGLSQRTRPLEHGLERLLDRVRGMTPDTLAAICVVAPAVLNPEDIGSQRGFTGLPAVRAGGQTCGPSSRP